MGNMAGMSDEAPDQSPTELLRLLNNIARTGRVEQVRAGNPARCRVRTGDLLTNWVPWFALAAGGAEQTRHWRTPALQEPCLLIAPGGDLAQALALPGLYSDDMPQGSSNPEVERHDFSSSDYWEHDRAAQTLMVDIAQSITLKVGDSTLVITPQGTTLTTPEHTVDAATTTFTGAVTIEGPLNYQAGISGTAGSGGRNVITGGFEVQGGAITHDGKNVGSSHTHPGDSGGTTGAPN